MLTILNHFRIADRPEVIFHQHLLVNPAGRKTEAKGKLCAVTDKSASVTAISPAIERSHNSLQGGILAAVADIMVC